MSRRHLSINQRPSLSERTASWLERRSGLFILAIVITTALLVVPMVLMAPDEQASDNPGGPVYDLEEQYNTNLPPRLHGAFFIVEARGDDVLTKTPLLELRENSEKLRTADAEGKLNPPGLPEQPYLYNGFDIDRQQPVVGIFTIADAVHEVLVNHPTLSTTLAEASEDQIKLALHHVFTDPRSSYLSFFLSQKKSITPGRVLGQEIDVWSSPALTFNVAADNEKLGGGGLRIGATSDPTTANKEHFNRNAQELLRGDENSYQLWGVAIDASLETQDEVGTAGPFIMATFLAVLVVVGISLRSGWIVLLTALGLAAMIVWLKGLSNLAGLNSSTILDFIVPIAMISLGADFLIHAVNRYREERSLGFAPRQAFRVGMAGVIGALTLAMITDAIAFVANTSAAIETVVGFGIGAGLAIFAAFVIMGLTVPVTLMRLDAWRSRRSKDQPFAEPASTEPSVASRPWATANVVMMLAHRRLLVLPIVAVITVVSGYYAFQLDATFDVKDFFKNDSDFATGLDKIDVHLGEAGGEPAIIYIEGDLTQPQTLGSISAFIDAATDNPYVAKNDEGEASIQARTVFHVLNQVIRSDYARAQIESASGVTLSTEGLSVFEYNGRTYKWPASREQLAAIYDYISVHGVPLAPARLVYDRLDVGETLFHDPNGQHADATAIVFGIPGTRAQTKVIRSRERLEEDLETLRAVPGLSLVGLTGSPYTRQASLDATTDGLQAALGIAVFLCLVVAVVAMRSVLLGVVTIIPIGLTVTWLYAFMYAFGFGLNFVTATIAAVSIGVGIDYAIHMTQRFREELRRNLTKEAALRKAAAGTGIALMTSAATSIVGFAIMGFAPMPMFSSYGILTAVMIFLSATASLLVLPSLLLLVTREKAASVVASKSTVAAD